jgi:hypothetical protein
MQNQMPRTKPTPLEYERPDVNRPRKRGLGYRPCGWAKASALFTALGWFIQLWLAARHGADTSLAACADVFLVFIFAIIPLALGMLLSLRSQRAGDTAFSVAMIAQGIALVAGQLLA